MKNIIVKTILDQIDDISNINDSSYLDDYYFPTSESEIKAKNRIKTVTDILD